MYAEGELRNNMDDSERVRDLQDKVAELKAEVSTEKVCTKAVISIAMWVTR